MKKIAFITNNKILAQSLEATIDSIQNLDFELFLLLDSQQILLDVEILEIDVALIDMALFDSKDFITKNKETPCALCEDIHQTSPKCRLLLLVSQEDRANRIRASKAKKNKDVEDFIFYDTSLKYLLAKLSTL